MAMTGTMTIDNSVGNFASSSKNLRFGEEEHVLYSRFRCCHFWLGGMCWAIVDACSVVLADSRP